jgi:hypothetical protein
VDARDSGLGGRRGEPGLPLVRCRAGRVDRRHDDGVHGDLLASAAHWPRRRHGPVRRRRGRIPPHAAVQPPGRDHRGPVSGGPGRDRHSGAPGRRVARDRNPAARRMDEQLVSRPPGVRHRLRPDHRRPRAADLHGRPRRPGRPAPRNLPLRHGHRPGQDRWTGRGGDHHRGRRRNRRVPGGRRLVPGRDRGPGARFRGHPARQGRCRTCRCGQAFSLGARPATGHPGGRRDGAAARRLRTPVRGHQSADGHQGVSSRRGRIRSARYVRGRRRDRRELLLVPPR